jgi:hypothetical protein
MPYLATFLITLLLAALSVLNRVVSIPGRAEAIWINIAQNHSDHGDISCCHTQMRRKNAKKSMGTIQRTCAKAVGPITKRTK